jgi:hypothetical protein
MAFGEDKMPEMNLAIGLKYYQSPCYVHALMYLGRVLLVAN